MADRDKIADAIADAAPAPTTITVNLKLPHDRTGKLVVPADTTAGEWFGIIAFLTGTVVPSALAELERAQATASPLVIARAVPRLPS